MRRILLVLTVALVMAVMVVAMAAGPVLAGNSFAKGQGAAEDCDDRVETNPCNPGEDVNDKVGDDKNNKANFQCEPFDNETQLKSPNGNGCSNN